ncbi:MAG: hypothetical protein JXA37_13710 [Chloroflexia bacterium]|nr:hypothetical protein [Chloroflexia bacterium]
MQIKEVFITSVGLYPQLITLALDLLLEQVGRNITDVVVIHTRPDPKTESPAGSDEKRPAELMDDCLQTLREEFKNGLYRDDFRCALQLIPLTWPNGSPLHDVLSPEEISIFWGVTHRLVRDFKAQGYRVHLSVAAGRKPMALYSLTTAQALLREDDFVWNLITETRAIMGPLHLDEKVNGRSFEAHLVKIPFVPAHEQVRVIFFDEGDDPDLATQVLIQRQSQQALQDLLLFAGHTEEKHPDQLTEREAEVARLVIQGHTNRQIALQLGLTHNRIRNLVVEIYDKAAAWFGLERHRINRAFLGYLLRPYLDWFDAGQHPLA